MSADAAAWPPLPLADWIDTRDTLHMWTQIVGKTRLALAPMVNHWWQVPLYVSPRGLTTSWIPYGTSGLSVEFDFIDHALEIARDDGRTWTMPLAPRSVADFYERYMAGLRSRGIDVRIWPVPVEIADPIPFASDTTHASYDAAAAHACWRALSQASRLLGTFRGRFIGKSSPVHFFWGSFDLACTRFNGERAPIHPGGVPGLADWATRAADSHPCIITGCWPGTLGGPVPEPAFHAYASPAPDGCPTAKIQPAPGNYNGTMHEWVLPYEAVRAAADPDAAALDFFQSTYEAAASLGGWDRAALERVEPARRQRARWPTACPKCSSSPSDR